MEPTTIIGILSMLIMLILILMACRIEKLERKVDKIAQSLVNQGTLRREQYPPIPGANVYEEPAKLHTPLPRGRTYWSRRDITGETF